MIYPMSLRVRRQDCFCPKDRVFVPLTLVVEVATAVARDLAFSILPPKACHEECKKIEVQHETALKDF